MKCRLACRWFDSVFLSRAFTLLIALIPLCFTQITSAEEPYPNQPIQLIVPFGPGGGSDTFARIIKSAIDEQGLLPQPLVIINVGGAGGSIGSRRAKDETPDGYTVLLLHDAIITAKLNETVEYGPEAFVAVAGTGQTDMVIAVHQDSPYNTLNDLFNAAAKTPDTITFAANLGAPSHYVGLLLEQRHGSAKFRYAQSGGGAERFASIKGKHVVTTAFSLEEYLRFQPDGIKALAYLGDERHHEVQDIPTAKEQGVNVSFSNMQYWWMPQGTPPEHAEYLASVLEKAMLSEPVQTKLKSMKIDPVFLTGSELQAHLVETELSLVNVNSDTESPLPNIPMTLAVLTALMGVTVVVQRVRKTNVTPVETEPTDANQWILVLISAGLVIAYAISIIVFEQSLGIMTTLFLLAMGFLLSGEARKTKPKFTAGLIVGVSLVVGILFHVVFTMLFQIAH